MPGGQPGMRVDFTTGTTMNYIHRLQEQSAEAQDALKAIDDQLADFRAHLLSGKFAGYDADGARRDWIATPDVLARVEQLRRVAQCAIVSK